MNNGCSILDKSGCSFCKCMALYDVGEALGGEYCLAVCVLGVVEYFNVAEHRKRMKSITNSTKMTRRIEISVFIKVPKKDNGIHSSADVKHCMELNVIDVAEMLYL